MRVQGSQSGVLEEGVQGPGETHSSVCPETLRKEGARERKKGKEGRKEERREGWSSDRY